MAIQARRDVFQAIADPTRRQIMGLVARERMNLNAIADNFEMSRPAISQHIKILMECGLLNIKQQGRERYCEVELQPLTEVADWMQPFIQMWEQRFNRLDDVLNQMKTDKKSKKMTTEKKLKLTAEPGKQELFIVREFEAPRDMVFKAYTDPDIIVKWLGPNGYKMDIDYYEGKSGGAYRYIHTDPKGNQYGFHGVIHEMHAPEMLIQTFEFEGMPTKGHVVLDTAIFEELPNSRTKLTIQSVFKSIADRDGMISSGMEYGLTEGFAKLDEILVS